MKNITIYLAEIAKTVDYGPDLIVERDAFDSMEKAEAFMVSFGMNVPEWATRSFGVWQKPTNPDYEGYITTLEVK